MGIVLPRAVSRAKRFQGPLICRFFMAQDVCIAIVGYDAKINGFRPVPLVLNRLHFEHGLPKMKSDGSLIRFVARIAFDLEFHNHISERTTGRKGMLDAKAKIGKPGF